MKYIKTYSRISEEIDLRKAIIGGAIGASSLFSNPAVSQNIEKTEMTAPASKEAAVSAFADALAKSCPEIVSDSSEAPSVNCAKPMSFLEKKFGEYSNMNPNFGLELRDLDLLSDREIPLRINFFYIRGVDTQRGPVLIPIVNFTYTKCVSISGHEVMFNLTRATGVTSFGASLKF